MHERSWTGSHCALRTGRSARLGRQDRLSPGKRIFGRGKLRRCSTGIAGYARLPSPAAALLAIQARGVADRCPRQPQSVVARRSSIGLRDSGMADGQRAARRADTLDSPAASSRSTCTGHPTMRKSSASSNASSRSRAETRPCVPATPSETAAGPGLSSGLNSSPSAAVAGGHRDRVCAVRERWRTPVNARQHCWKACWGQPLRSSNLLSSATSDQAIHEAGSCVRLGLRGCAVSYRRHRRLKWDRWRQRLRLLERCLGR
jgi:hypothetical protein